MNTNQPAAVVEQQQQRNNASLSCSYQIQMPALHLNQNNNALSPEVPGSSKNRIAKTTRNNSNNS